MRTVIFATCYAGKPASVGRYKKYLNYYLPKLNKLGAQRLFLIDDGSPLDCLYQLGIPVIELDKITQRDYPELTEQAYIFRFPDNLGRPVQTVMPGWWRSFSFVSVLAYVYGLDKLIHVESDVYLFTERIFEWIRSTNSRWTVPFGRQYRYPLSEIQVIPKFSKINWYSPEKPKNNFQELFNYFIKGKEFWYKDNIGNSQYIPEYVLPFDEVVYDFKGDRYGEDWCKKVPEQCDFISNIDDVSLNNANHKCIGDKSEAIKSLIESHKEEGGGPDILTGFHTGDFGDIIYCMPVMKELGIKHLVLNPLPWYGSKMNRSNIKCIKPLLERHGISVGIAPDDKPYHYDICLDDFRHTKQDLCFTHLGKSQGYPFGVDADLSMPWLFAEPNPVKPIVINRSNRYHSVFFKWNELLYGLENKCCFVGLPDEYEAFTKETGLNVQYHPTADFVELAGVIAGADWFIGNQSGPYAVAEGLKCNRIQETCEYMPNCKPEGDGGRSVDNLESMFEAIKVLRSFYNK